MTLKVFYTFCRFFKMLPSVTVKTSKEKAILLNPFCLEWGWQTWLQSRLAWNVKPHRRFTINFSFYNFVWGKIFSKKRKPFSCKRWDYFWKIKARTLLCLNNVWVRESPPLYYKTVKEFRSKNRKWKLLEKLHWRL